MYPSMPPRHRFLARRRAFQELIIEDVRCFAGHNRLKIRPVTLLVGENSTGKSTVLGCIQALAGISRRLGTYAADFNLAPFNMGVFADIVRKSSPLNKSFRLGFGYDARQAGHFDHLFHFEEGENLAEPIITSVGYDFSDGGAIHLDHSQKNNNVSSYSIKKEAPNKFLISDPEYVFSPHVFLGDREFAFHFFNKSKYYDEFMQFFKDKQKEYSFTDFYDYNAMESFSPIRSVPRRTYDPVRISGAPDGSDAPQKLRNMDKKTLNALTEELASFGKASGMFDRIQVRTLGAANDPFQIKVKVRNGPAVSLVDVGYGISQVIPILVQILTSRASHFLLQQPEVHLHPKAQAELASLLVQLHSSRNKRYPSCFILETHSDQIIDRIRIEIMKKKIQPDDVSLIYLHPLRNKTQVHNISFDAQANMIGVPQGYRDFFSRESDRLLGIDK